MDWTIPEDISKFLDDMDAFIDKEIIPIQEEYPELFDHRREYTRTDVARGGVPTAQWREVMAEARRRSDRAGFYHYGLPKELGGRDGSNLAMALIRERLTLRGPGLHAELAHEASTVGNVPIALALNEYGTPEQKEQYLEGVINGEGEIAFGLTEPNHGSDATWMETTARRDSDDWIITGAKRFNSLVDVSVANMVFARTSGQPGKADGITAFLVPMDLPGHDIQYYHWTMEMPTDHGEVHLDKVRVPHSTILGDEGKGLAPMQVFVHENRIRQAASGVGATQFCIDRSVKYAEERVLFGKFLRDYQGIQWQLVELQTETEFIRNTVYKVAAQMDQMSRKEHEEYLSGVIAMCNYKANQLVCNAADRAMQIHGGSGFSRHQPFESIYRHHRRYRLTEGSDEVQMRRIANRMFDFKKQPPPRTSL